MTECTGCFDLVICISSRIRALKSEVQELEELEKENETYFASEIKEMEGFTAEVAKFDVESRREVQKLKNQVEQVNYNEL